MNDKILKHIPQVTNYNPDKKGTNLGFIIDTETTDLTKDSEIFELAIIPFMFDDDLNICEVKAPLVKYNKPTKPISDKAKKITGIDESLLEGQTFDIPKLKALLERGEVIISHNAAFDRHFLEKELGLSDVVWGCSMNDVNWKEKTYNTRVLDYIAFRLGYWFEAHKASWDTLALLHILNQKIESDKTIFQEVFERIYEPSCTLVLKKSKFAEKEVIKELGFKWNGNEKYWYIDNVLDENELRATLNKKLTDFEVEIIHNNPKLRYKNSY